MAKTLKEEFESERRRDRLLFWSIPGVIVLIGLAIWLWPPSTLRDAIGSSAAANLKAPYRGQPFKNDVFMSWSWVDASRRSDMTASLPANTREIVDVMFGAAEGRPFLFSPMYKQAFIPARKGAVFVLWLDWNRQTGFARDKDGGPVLDVKPYKVKPNIVVVPLDVLAPYVTQKAKDSVHPFWSVYLTVDGAPPPVSERNELIIADPVAAAHFGKGQPS
jgi:hypothetical protein